jgi:hypothetical protein
MPDGGEIVAEEARLGAVLGARGRGARSEVEDSSGSGAELNGESAGVEVDPSDRKGIEGADETLEILKMKRIRQLNSIELDQHVLELGTAYVRSGGEVGGESRSSAQSLQRIVHGARRDVDVLPRHHPRPRERKFGIGVTAREHGDLTQRLRARGCCGRRRRWRRTGALRQGRAGGPGNEVATRPRGAQGEMVNGEGFEES